MLGNSFSFLSDGLLNIYSRRVVYAGMTQTTPSMFTLTNEYVTKCNGVCLMRHISNKTNIEYHQIYP